jgi:hypothetical protein
LWEKQPKPFMTAVFLPGFEKNISQIRAVYKSMSFSKWSLAPPFTHFFYSNTYAHPPPPNKGNRNSSKQNLWCEGHSLLLLRPFNPAGDLHQTTYLFSLLNFSESKEKERVQWRSHKDEWEISEIVSLITQGCSTLYHILISILKCPITNRTIHWMASQFNCAMPLMLVLFPTRPVFYWELRFAREGLVLVLSQFNLSPYRSDIARFTRSKNWNSVCENSSTYSFIWRNVWLLFQFYLQHGFYFSFIYNIYLNHSPAGNKP